MPEWKSEIRERLAALNIDAARESEIIEEISQHLDDRFAELRAQGFSDEEGRREALAELRGDEFFKRESRGFERPACAEPAATGNAKGNFLDGLLSDLKFGARTLRKNRGFTAVAVLTLALGIGANTAIFSVVDAVLLRPLPYANADRLVSVCESNPRLGFDQYVTSMGAYADWRNQNSVFQQLGAATVLGPAPVFGKGEGEMVHAAAVSADFFPLLGIRPLLGRQFLPEEESPDRGDVVLLSENLWRQHFGADPGIVNQTIVLGDKGATVVGVMPASVRLFDPEGVQGWDNGFSKCELWRPLPVDSGLRKHRSYRAFLVLGRLKPNVSIAQARTEMTNIARQQERDFPDSNAGWSVTVQSWQSAVVRNVRMPLILLLGAVGFVLLIATANLGNLSLARAAARQKEFAIRLALGAGRLRVARVFLVESLLLSCMGAACGAVLAKWSMGILRGIIPANVPRVDEISLNGQVLAFTFAVSLTVGVLFGLAPLWNFWRSDLNGSLKLGVLGSTGTTSGRRLRACLVAAEVALVMVLLTGAGLLMRSFQRLTNVNPGFQPMHLVALDVSIGGPGHTNQYRGIAFVAETLARLLTLPGVESAAAVDGLPLDAGRANMEVALTSIDGDPTGAPKGKLIATMRLASPGYFHTMGIPISQGRFFTDQDSTNAPPVAIINETLARRYFPGGNPVGKRIGSPDFGSQPCEIIGVIKDVRQASLDATAEPEVYRPLLQECFSSMTIVARSRSDSPQALAALQGAVAGVDRTWPAYNPRTVDRLLSASLAPRRFALLLLGLFAGLALMLAVIGIYGVLSCVVGERIREIGIRLALGARRGEVFRMILLSGLRSVAIGAFLGLTAAWALARFLGVLLYELSPSDPLTLASVALVVTVAAVAAGVFPARRAARVDPIKALRCE